MSSLNLEISDKEYIIKLDRNDFTLSALQKLIKRVQHNHNNFPFFEDEPYTDVRSHIDDQYIDSYDHLSEK